MGDMGSSVVRRASDCSAPGYDSFPRRLLPFVMPKTGDGSESDAERLPAIDSSAGQERGRAWLAGGGFWRRGAGHVYAAALVGTQSKRTSPVDKHVRDY